MAKEVASLYATIGADTSGLKKGLEETHSGLKDAGLKFTELSSIIGLAQQGLEMLGEVYSATVGETLAYTKTVRDLAENLALTTEETSRLIQTADDYGVEMGQVQQAMEMALKNGFAPSIETLADMADKYNAIADPTERAAELTKVFGRNWADLTPMLKEGGQAIRDAAASQADALIITEESAQAARDYEIAMDAFGDTVDGLKYKIGNSAIPALTRALNDLNGAQEWFRKQNPDGLEGVIMPPGGMSKGQIDKLRLSMSSYSEELRYLRDEEALTADEMGQFADTTTVTTAALTEQDITLQAANNMYSNITTSIDNTAGAMLTLMDFTDKTNSAFANMFEGLNPNIASPIKGMIDDIKWMQAGGGDIETAFANLKRQFMAGQITADEAKTYFSQLLAAAENAETEAGMQTGEQAKKDLVANLNITDAEATDMLAAYQDAWDILTNAEQVIKSRIDVDDPSGVLRLLNGGSGSFTVNVNTTVSGGGSSSGGSGTGYYDPYTGQWSTNSVDTTASEISRRTNTRRGYGSGK